MNLKAYVLLYELKGIVSNMVENDEAPYILEDKLNEIISTFGNIEEIDQWTSQFKSLKAI